MHNEINVHIKEAADEIVEMLLLKNKAYGDSALNPLRIFSKADADEGIKVRIDDKLSRIKNQGFDDSEDAVKDLTGYLILYLAGQRSNEKEYTNEIIKEKAKRVLEKTYYSYWNWDIIPETCTKDRKGLYKNKLIFDALDVVEQLNKGTGFEEVNEIIKKQGHSGASLGYLHALIPNLCRDGRSFVNWLKQ